MPASRTSGWVSRTCGSGIGRAADLRFVDAGANVVVADINADAAKAIDAEIEAARRWWRDWRPQRPRP